MEGYRKYGELLVLKNEEKLLMRIAPGEYIDDELSSKKEMISVEGRYLVDFFQDELREILHSFLNGGMNVTGYLTYPLMQQISMDMRRKLRRLSRILEIHRKGGKGTFSKGEPRSISECAEAIAWLYGEFENFKAKGGKLVKKPSCKQFDSSMYGPEHAKYASSLIEIEKIARSMTGDVAGMYLHGSFATNDFVKGWSDCDTLCIVSKKAIRDPKRLMAMRSKFIEMRKYFHKIDPLQHHGTMIASEYDLDSYPQGMFPITLFGYARSFGKDGVRQVRLRNSTLSHARFFWSVNFFRTMVAKKHFSMDPYELKNVLHQIALFPSLYLQAKGTYVYKKFSFAKARKDFSKEMWWPIDEMTRVRNGWKEVPVFPGIGSFANINPFVAYQMNARLITLVKPMSGMDIDAKRLIECMHLLSEEAWKKIRI